MKQNLFLFGILAVTVFGFSGCATIIDGNKQAIAITSEPSGAIAQVGSYRITTPGQVTLKRGKSYAVTCSKEGYETATSKIRCSIAPWFWANILLGGIPGMIVDGVTGAYGQLAPDIVHVKLEPIRGTGTTGTTGSRRGQAF